MKTTVQELDQIVNEYAEKFSLMSEEEFDAKPFPDKWSKKEVVGHLIDSAQNNLRRFIVGQYEAVPSKIVYDQDFWVNTNGYQRMNKSEIIQLFKLINGRISAVLINMPESNYQKNALTSELHSLQWLAVDYVKHLKHHLNQIIANSFDIIYK